MQSVLVPLGTWSATISSVSGRTSTLALLFGRVLSCPHSLRKEKALYYFSRVVRGWRNKGIPYFRGID